MNAAAKKKIRFFALTLAFLSAAGALWLFYHRDWYIASAIQKYGSAILGVNVKLKSAHLSVTDQSVELTGLTIENPAGFHARRLLQLGSVTVKLDVSSLANEVVLIREISILKPEITYERGSGPSNLDVIQRNALSYAEAVMGRPEKTAKPEKRWIISHLIVRDGQALVLSDMVITNSLSIHIPNLHLRDIGKRTNGATTADATQQVMAALSASVDRAVGDAISGAAKDVGKGLERGVKDIGNALNGLFGH